MSFRCRTWGSAELEWKSGMEVEGRRVTVGVKFAADCEEDVERPRPRVMISFAIAGGASSWPVDTVAVPGRSDLEV